jgi:FixJ family two-component response regulator
MAIRLDCRRAGADVSNPLVSVIDDDDGVRESLESLLGSFGYRVSAFASAEAFLASHSRAETACLISDIRLPGGMSGAELAERMEAEADATPVILISATENAAALNLHKRRELVCFLQKPFRAEHLLECVRTALA